MKIALQPTNQPNKQTTGN